MSIRLIINFFLDIVFVDRKLNKTELKKAELLLYEVKDSICEFYLAEFIKEKKEKNIMKIFLDYIVQTISFFIKI